MSAFTRMMEDYDYHKHTGELPEYFGGGNENNRGCGFGIFVAIVLFSAFLYATCGSDKKDNPKQQKTELVNQPVQVPLIPSDPSTVPQTPVVSDDEVQKIVDPEPQPQPTPVKTVKISRYYEEGYEKGYDDGEDDAVMDNGWGGQFDDECRYSGQKKKDYQLGYEEGYEAGYFDNKDSDE